MSGGLKRQTALAALDEIRDGMIVGLGSGSTASIFIRELGLALDGVDRREEIRGVDSIERHPLALRLVRGL